MKRMVLRGCYLISILILQASALIAQSIDLDLLNESSLIIEGEVIRQEYRYSPEVPEDIQTVNYIAVTEVLKGNVGNNKVAIITEGGIKDGIIQSYSHYPTLAVGERGIFFLTGLNMENDVIFSQMTGNNKSLFSYTRNQVHEVYCTREHTYIESLGDVKRQINPLYDFEVSLTSDSSELCLTIDNIIPNFVESTVSFDVKVKANQTGYKLSELHLGFEYPKENLGEFIVQNVRMEVSKGPVITDEIYGVTEFDIESEKAGVSIITDCTLPQSFQLNEYYTLGTSFEKLITIKLQIENWGGLGDLSIEDFAFDGSAKHIVEESNCVDFDLLCVDRGEFQLVPCALTSFTTSPFGAGVQQIMDINGSGFGTGGMLEIPNADDGGASKLTVLSTDTRWVKSWSDSTIEVLVSSIAPGDHPMGSGEWIVTPMVNMSCMDTVDIEYAIDNTYAAPYERMNSIATNPFVGNTTFNWYIDSAGIASNAMLISQGISYSDVLSVCQAAFCDWETASGLEFKFAGINNNGQNNSDQKYTVTVGNLPGTQLAVTKTIISMGLCDTLSDPYIDGRLRDADIIFDEKDKWHVSTSASGIASNEYDLYSVMLHEIGHLLLMKHAMDVPMNGTMDDRIMYWSLNPMQIKTTIDGKTLNGINVQKSRTQNALSGCLNGFAMDTSTDGCMTSAENIFVDYSIFYPNPVPSGQTFQIYADKKIEEISIFDFTGKLIKRVNISNSSVVDVQAPTLSGSYIMLVSFGDFRGVYKLIAL
ncbi:MAG TPA: matrixin family metalloprotease [Saprospiraceae bacterium]|nr:matrixin family metalloprotease [Saprospiraceae bacterium]